MYSLYLSCKISEIISEPSTPIVVGAPLVGVGAYEPGEEKEESIYEELCYITFRIKQVC